MASHRKWTAAVLAGDADVTDLLDLSDVNDTLRDTERAAVILFDACGVEDGRVVIHKQLTRDPAPRRDRSHYVYRDECGRVRMQFMGA